MTKLTEYVKTAEAAEILGVAQNTLRKWAGRGEIPMHRNPANGHRLFKRTDLQQFLKRVDVLVQRDLESELVVVIPFSRDSAVAHNV
ncbi:MAG: helix-turn-helix domain-containing protein [Pirellulaceae bacterium]